MYDHYWDSDRRTRNPRQKRCDSHHVECIHSASQVFFLLFFFLGLCNLSAGLITASNEALSDVDFGFFFFSFWRVETKANDTRHLPWLVFPATDTDTDTDRDTNTDTPRL